VLPSGDIEGLTWAKLRRKERIYRQNLVRCERCKVDLADLEQQRSLLIAARPEHQVQQIQIQAHLSGIARSINRLSKIVSREAEFKRDLTAFASLHEYLKTKVNGCQVYVHFHHNGGTLPVDIDDLKRSRVRPIQVFEVAKDPIKNREES
jgi:hypothetical protein